MRNQKRLAELKRIEPLPLPPSLEAAFLAIERPAPRYADAPEPSPGRPVAPRRPRTHDQMHEDIRVTLRAKGFIRL